MPNRRFTFINTDHVDVIRITFWTHNYHFLRRAYLRLGLTATRTLVDFLPSLYRYRQSLPLWRKVRPYVYAISETHTAHLCQEAVTDSQEVE
jgi:hypothetical protein